MSKAFTSEETPEPTPVLRAPPRLAPGEVRWVTPEGHAALRAELARLTAGRPGAAPARRAELDARLALVEGTLAALTVLSPDEAPEGTVGFGSWVTVEDPSGARSTWRIVGPDEVDARRGLIGAGAPVARALLGHRAGDEVEVVRPGGPVTLTVMDVRHRVTAFTRGRGSRGPARAGRLR